MFFGFLILAIFIILGILLGQNISIPYSAYQYVAVAILACLDSVFGALAASTGKNFKMKIFLAGFFFNAIFAIFLVYLGELLNVEIYYCLPTAQAETDFITYLLLVFQTSL